MHIELLPLPRLKPYDKYPRLNDASVEAVASSIREFVIRQSTLSPTARRLNLLKRLFKPGRKRSSRREKPATAD